MPQPDDPTIRGLLEAGVSPEKIVEWETNMMFYGTPEAPDIPRRPPSENHPAVRHLRGGT